MANIVFLLVFLVTLFSQFIGSQYSTNTCPSDFGDKVLKKV